jgi:hypothetical protein
MFPNIFHQIFNFKKLQQICLESLMIVLILGCNVSRSIRGLILKRERKREGVGAVKKVDQKNVMNNN